MAGHSQQPDGPINGINVTPLVDITLVLLIIFMVTAKMVVMPAVPLDLPRAASTAEQVQVVLAVTVPLRRPFAINGIEVAGDQAFVERVRAEAARSSDVRAVIAADGQVPHEQVLHVLDLIRRAGITRVAFGAKAIEPSSVRPSP